MKGAADILRAGSEEDNKEEEDDKEEEDNKECWFPGGAKFQISGL